MKTDSKLKIIFGTLSLILLIALFYKFTTIPGGMISPGWFLGGMLLVGVLIAALIVAGILKVFFNKRTFNKLYLKPIIKQEDGQSLYKNLVGFNFSTFYRLENSCCIFGQEIESLTFEIVPDSLSITKSALCISFVPARRHRSVRAGLSAFVADFLLTKRQ